MDAESEKRAIEFAENDPAVKSGVFTYQVKEWSTVLSKYEGNKSNYDQGYLDYKHEKQKELGIYDMNFKNRQCLRPDITLWLKYIGGANLSFPLDLQFSTQAGSCANYSAAITRAASH